MREVIIINCQETNSQYRHCTAVNGDDRTLCGQAYEGMGNKDSREPTKLIGKINCPECINIIQECKQILKKDIETK